MTPIKAAEVCARVRRLLTGSSEPGRVRVTERGPEAVELKQLIGEDPVFVAVKRKLPLVAQCEAPVLLTGETGTGKELCAQALHYLSRRAGKPFLPVNCGALPVELFESELFGHLKGAFTGAWAAQPGLIADAEGGTLFLDEIDSLSLGAQVKLLRFLEDRSYRAVGSGRPRQADVWILAATNVELVQKVREGVFRPDLFYRLAVLTLLLPPLRERRADIPQLAAHFWGRYAVQPRGDPRRFSPRAVEAFYHYAWPGNIRELENVIRHVAVLTDVQTIEPEDLPLPRLPAPPASREGSLKQARAQVVEEFERAFLTDLLQVHGGNVTRAAQAAHTERRVFGRLIKKHHIPKR